MISAKSEITNRQTYRENHQNITDWKLNVTKWKKQRIAENTPTLKAKGLTR
jgi:hypothetical protein